MPGDTTSQQPPLRYGSEGNEFPPFHQVGLSDTSASTWLSAHPPTDISSDPQTQFLLLSDKTPSVAEIRCSRKPRNRAPMLEYCIAYRCPA